MGGPAAVGAPDRWQPRVALNVRAELPPARIGELRDSLKAALRRCGVLVLEPNTKRPALSLEVVIEERESTGGRTIQVDWEMGEPASPEQLPTLGPVRGHWVIAEPAAPVTPWLERIAVQMAQDALRLWAAPRWTVLRLLDVDEEQVQALEEIVGQYIESYRQEAGDKFEVVVSVPVAGDPLSAAQRLLDVAGIAELVEPVELTLTRLTYRFKGAPEPDSTAQSKE